LRLVDQQDGRFRGREYAQRVPRVPRVARPRKLVLTRKMSIFGKKSFFSCRNVPVGMLFLLWERSPRKVPREKNDFSFPFFPLFPLFFSGENRKKKKKINFNFRFSTSTSTSFFDFHVFFCIFTIFLLLQLNLKGHGHAFFKKHFSLLYSLNKLITHSYTLLHTLSRTKNTHSFSLWHTLWHDLLRTHARTHARTRCLFLAHSLALSSLEKQHFF
jgi:hypothetical protein